MGPNIYTKSLYTAADRTTSETFYTHTHTDPLLSRTAST